MSRLTSTRPVRQLAALLSLLMILLGCPTGGAFALCLDAGGHLAIEAVHADCHDQTAAAPCAETASHASVGSDCIDVPLLQSAPLTVKGQGVGDHSDLLGLPVAVAFQVPAPRRADRASASPVGGPELDPRLISHRTVVLRN